MGGDLDFVTIQWPEAHASARKGFYTTTQLERYLGSYKIDEQGKLVSVPSGQRLFAHGNLYLYRAGEEGESFVAEFRSGVCKSIKPYAASKTDRPSHADLLRIPYHWDTSWS